MLGSASCRNSASGAAVESMRVPGLGCILRRRSICFASSADIHRMVFGSSPSVGIVGCSVRHMGGGVRA